MAEVGMHLKVVYNEKYSKKGRQLSIIVGSSLGYWRSRFVYLIILPSSFLHRISITAK
jgi:hypothetical protein